MAHLFAHLPEQRALPPFEHLNPLDIEQISKVGRDQACHPCQGQGCAGISHLLTCPPLARTPQDNCICLYVR